MNLNTDQLLNLFKNMCEFDKTLNLEIQKDDQGKIYYQMKVGARHSSRPGVAHGGSVAAMMDAVLGITSLEKAVSEGMLCSTVEFKINYLRPALEGDILVGHATIEFSGRSLIVTSAYIATHDKIVAKAQGTFNLYPIDDKSMKEFASFN